MTNVENMHYGEW